MLPTARRANSALAESQRRADHFARRNRELADHLPVAIFELDRSGKIIYANAEWRAFSRCSAEALEHILHPDDAAGYADALADAVARGVGLRHVLRKRRHDGVWRKIREDIRPLEQGGQIFGFAGCSTDITDEMEARDAAFRLGAQIQSAFRQRDVLMTEVHHRVKNNLQAILSMIGLHARRVNSPPARRDLDIVARRIRAMATIQQELHDDADVSRIDLVLYIRRVAEALARLHGRDDVAIHIEGEWADVSIGTAAAVGAIIAELLANCFDHGVKGQGRVRIAMTRKAAQAFVDLSDSGPGFDAAAAREDGIGLIVAERIARHSRIGMERGEGPGMPWRIAVPLQD